MHLTPQGASRSWLAYIVAFIAVLCLFFTVLPLAHAQTESPAPAETAESTEELATAVDATEPSTASADAANTAVANEEIPTSETPEDLAQPAQEVAGNVVECGDGCTSQTLNELIKAAGDEPTTIALPSGDTILSGSVTIPAGTHITFASNGDSRLVRADGVTSTMINVARGGTLVMDGAVTVDGANVRDSSDLVTVRGTMILNDGTIKGGRGLKGYHRGAVSVIGSDAYFEMNGGQITDNQRNLYENCRIAACRGAGNLAIDGGAKAIMNGGEISYGRVNTAASGEAGGVGVFNGGSFEMNGGSIHHNTGWAGGVGVYQLERFKDSVEAFEARRASFTLNDGEISFNKAFYGGGGVLVYSNAEFYMMGGTITRNESATQGGGIAVVDDYMNGIPGTTRESPSFGKSLGYTHEEWQQRSPGRFVLEGGTITQNWAPGSGGGVYVLSADVTLKGGDIVDNSAGQQGGGLYVATISYSAQLFNVLVTENQATHIGGGIWLCPTGSLEFHMTEGGAVFDNTATTYGDDLAHDNLNGAGSLPTYLSRHQLGFGETHYYQDGGKPDGEDLPRFDPEAPGTELVYQGAVAEEDRVEGLEYRRSIYAEGLKQITTDAAKEQARQFAQLRITQNKAPRGAGIGSNGGVIIGTDGYDIPVEKIWKDRQGNEITPVDGSVNPALPESITVQLFAHLVDGQKLPVGEPRTITAGSDGTWSYVFEDVAGTVNHQAVRYSLEEVDAAGFSSTVHEETTT